MKNFSKSLNFILPAIFVLVFFVFSIHSVVAGSEAVQGLRETAIQGFGGEGAPVDSAANEQNANTFLSTVGVVTSLPGAIGKVIGAVLAFLGVIFLLLMIYGGGLWMFARGNEQEVTKAKDLIISAVIGLVIILSAYAITTYIGSNLS